MSRSAVNVQLIQVNIFVSFGIDRVRQLISELNVHYNTLLNYRESGLSAEELTKDLVDAYAKLYELDNLIRYRCGSSELTTILDSIIALLELTEQGQPVRSKLKALGKQIVEQLHPSSLNHLLDEALRYKWLRKYGLVSPSMSSPERRVSSRFWQYGTAHEKPIINQPPYYRFEPTDIELEEYFNKNKVDLLHYLVNDVQPNSIAQNPMERPGVSDLYHYTVYLNKF
jgi:hypothetical protein